MPNLGLPLVSYYVIAYNQEKFIRQAAESALSQSYQPLEVILSDDCSTDNTFSILQEIVNSYDGPHEVFLRRNPVNLGVGAHINEILKVSNGDVIVASAGDDWSVPDRVSRLIDWWRDDAPSATLVYANILEVNEIGAVIRETDFRMANREVRKNKRGTVVWRLEDHMASRSLPLHGASFAYLREVFDSCGPFYPGVVFEDNVLNVRAEILGEVALCPEFLVYHRNHPDQVTSKYSAGALQNPINVRKRLKWSDVRSLRQNEDDLKKLYSQGFIGPVLYEKALMWFKRRIEEIDAEYAIEFKGWPRRIWFLLKDGIGRGKCNLNGRLVVRSLLPDVFYMFVLQIYLCLRSPNREKGKILQR